MSRWSMKWELNNEVSGSTLALVDRVENLVPVVGRR